MFHIPKFILGSTELRLAVPVEKVVQLTVHTTQVLSPKPAKESTLIIGTGRGRRGPLSGIVRRKLPSATRLGCLPEAWFDFLHPGTGVSGPYILLLGLTNFVASKEFLVMEHEFYSGISVALVVYFITTQYGRNIAAALDDGITTITNTLEDDRQAETASHIEILTSGKLAIMQARGQETLMVVKKENIALQLEAVYRERVMMVYREVRARLEFHKKAIRIRQQIQRKWMMKWILTQVYKSITPEFKKQAITISIKDLATAAAQAK